MPKLLIVDDDSFFLDRLVRALGRTLPDWEIVTANGSEEILATDDPEAYMTGIDVVLSDTRMPGMNGADLFQFFWANGSLNHPTEPGDRPSFILMSSDFSYRVMKGRTAAEFANVLDIPTWKKSDDMEALVALITDV